MAATIYRREQGLQRFGQKLDSEDGAERSGRGLPEGTLETHLHVEKARVGAWPLGGIPCKGLQQGLGGSLRASRYFGKNTGVIDGSLHISTLLVKLPHLLCSYYSFCGRDSNTLAKL